MARRRAIQHDDRGHTQSPGYDKVKIRYCAVPNANHHVGGWLPLYSVNGHPHSDTWSGRGLGKDVALRKAARAAQGEADHYSGDWNVTVRKGRLGKRMKNGRRLTTCR